MFSSFSNYFQVPNFGLGRRNNEASIDIPPAQIYDVETAAEKRARTLKHLIKLNHTNHSIIYHNLQFHNHAPHILGSAYVLGASSEQLNTIYDRESTELEPWKDSPGEISKDDWRDFLCKREYQRAFVDFFEDQLVQYGYDWKKLLSDYLLEGQEPLIHNLISDLGHPLIHLGYAYELNSRTVGIEALALAACCRNNLHKYLDDPSYTKPSSYSAKSVLEILRRVAMDQRFEGLFEQQGENNIELLFKRNEDAVLDHWNAWSITDPKEQFIESQKAATALLVATHRSGDTKFDFFLVHLLTTSHAVRILLPLLPARFQVALVRQWLLFTITVYVAQLRLPIKLGRIEGYHLEGKDWAFVEDRAINSKHATDAHFVKAIRAMKVAAETWGDNEKYYLKAAVKFAVEFDSWGGFGPLSAEDEKFISDYRKWAIEGKAGEGEQL